MLPFIMITYPLALISFVARSQSKTFAEKWAQLRNSGTGASDHVYGRALSPIRSEPFENFINREANELLGVLQRHLMNHPNQEQINRLIFLILIC